MQIYGRDFIEPRYTGDGAQTRYFLDDHQLDLKPGDHTDYIIRRITQSPAIDLAKGPTLMVCMGGFQTEDLSIPRTLEEMKAEFNSGTMPQVKAFLEKMVRHGDLDPVLKNFAAGLEKMNRGYFRMTDEVFAQPALQMKPPATYLVSYDSLEGRMGVVENLRNVDQNRFYSYEAMDFVSRVMAPCLGEYTVTQDKIGMKTVHINKRNPLEDIIKKTENIMFLGNSSGGNFIVEVENALTDILQHANFPKQDIAKIMRSIRAVGIGNLADYEKLKGPRFTSIYFEGLNDLVAQAINSHKIVITPEDIARYCPPEQQEMLAKAAAEHYRRMESAFGEKRSDVDAGKFPLAENQVFMPRFQADDNRMLVLSNVPTSRSRWVLNNTLIRPKIPKNPIDTHTERQFKAILENVGADKNGHHIALHMAQGYPPYYLVALVHKILLNMAAYPSLPSREKERFEAADFMTKDLARYNIDQSAQSVADKTMLLDAVRYGLERAKAPQGDKRIAR